MSFLVLTGNSLASVLKGMGVTLLNLVQWPKRVQTVMYPEEKVPLYERTRGMPIVDLETCIGCYACEKICPNNLIKIETVPGSVKGKREVVRFDLDYALCMLCNLCEDVCPTDPVPEKRAITLTPGISVVNRQRRDLRQGVGGGRYIGPVPVELRHTLQPAQPAPQAEPKPEEAPEAAPGAEPKPAATKEASGNGVSAAPAAPGGPAVEDAASAQPPAPKAHGRVPARATARPPEPSAEAKDAAPAAPPAAQPAEARPEGEAS